MKFQAEVIEVKAKKTQSMDREYRLVLITDNPVVLELDKFIAEQAINIDITI